MIDPDALAMGHTFIDEYSGYQAGVPVTLTRLEGEPGKDRSDEIATVCFMAWMTLCAVLFGVAVHYTATHRHEPKAAAVQAVKP